MAELAGNRFISRLQGITSKKGIINARKGLHQGLQKYSEIRRTSQTLRSDVTVEQQHRVTERLISVRKLKEIRTIGEGRGRKLKSTQFPELSTVLLHAFGEYNVRDDGGGIEAHPRLSTGTLYRAVDSAMIMKRVREILHSVAPENFKISLSSC